MQSKLIQCMAVASLKVMHNFYVRRSKFYFRQTLLHFHKFEATVSDSLSNFYFLLKPSESVAMNQNLWVKLIGKCVHNQFLWIKLYGCSCGTNE